MTQGQIPLDLAGDPSFARDDFLVTGSNAAAWSFMESWPMWPDKIVMLAGPSGSGKSHLAAMWAERAGAASVASERLAGQDLQRLLASGAAVVEDADRACGLEKELFHLLNKARSERAFVVVTARTPPDAWRLATPDLLSRVREAPLLSLRAPDEELMRAVLVKLFRDRQLLIEAPVVDYLALRLDRSLDSARRFVDALDREALARARRVTRPLVAQVLAAFDVAELDPSD